MVRIVRRRWLWAGVPANTKSLVLIVDDPDAPDPAAPKMIWVHWLLYNLPPETTGLPEGVASKDLPAGTLQGVNDWQRTGYGGPCPPIGRHRYFHKLYALDGVLPDLKQPTKAALEKAMQGHILTHAELIGVYQRAALMCPVPDQLAVLVDVLDPMKRNFMRKAVGVDGLKAKMISGVELDAVERQLDHLVVHPVVIADHEAAFRIGRVPAYPVEQFMDGDHGGQGGSMAGGGASIFYS